MSYSEHPDCPAALALAEQLADVARRIARRYFRMSVEVARKADGTPVTLADRGIEEQMRALIRAAFPSHAIRGEEYPSEGSGELTWVLDPIDGTKSFISGYPLFGSLIALAEGSRAVLGVIEAPALEERWVGVEGRRTLFNGVPAQTSRCRDLARAILYTTTAETFEGAERTRFEALGARCALRRFGGDCYLFGMLASGHCDLVVEAKLKPHDFMALIPVIEGAGGRITDWHGAALDLSSDGRVIAAATEELWRESVEVLSAG